MFYWFIWYLFNFLKGLFFTVKVIGLENVPRSGGFIFAVNHKSYLDPMVIGMISRRRIRFVARDSLFRNWLFGGFIRALGAFPVKRDSADIGAIKQIFNALKQEYGVLIFPEGTRVSDDGERKVQAGIGMIALKSGVPIVPVYISGSDRVLPPGAKKITRGCITVTFGPPTQYSDKKESYADIANQIMSNILQLEKTLPPLK